MGLLDLFDRKDDAPKAGESAQAGGAPADQPLDDRTFQIVDTALRAQRPLAAKYVRSLRAKRAGLSDDELIAHVEKRFLAMLTASGAGVGGVAALPGVGTMAAVALTAGEGVAFAEACAFLTLAVADIRGVDMSDPARRRTVMLGVLGGEKGAEIIGKALGKQGAQWSTVLSGVAPDYMVKFADKQVRTWIKRKLAARMGGLWAGRLIPFGVGALIGGAGNRVVARSVIEAERTIFSQAPSALLDAPEA